MYMNLIDFGKYKYFIYAFFTILTFSIVAYYCFGIYVLINDYEDFKVSEEYCDTKIWYYVLLCLIINCDKLLFRNYYSKEENLRLHISITLLELVMLIFGGIEIFRNDACLKENNPNFFYTGLWRFALANFILQMVTTLFFTKNLITFFCEKKNNNIIPVGVEYFEDINEFENLSEDHFRTISIV